MGLSASGDEYCYRGDVVFSDLPNTVKVVDDVCVWSPDLQNHELHVRKFIDRCRERSIPPSFVSARNGSSSAGIITAKAV